MECNISSSLHHVLPITNSDMEIPPFNQSKPTQRKIVQPVVQNEVTDDPTMQDQRIGRIISQSDKTNYMTEQTPNKHNRDEQIIKALADITTILVNLKNYNKTKNEKSEKYETIEKIKPSENQPRMIKFNQDIKRTNRLSANLAKQLDNIGYTTNNDNDSDQNQNFLKVMTENMMKMEQKIKQIERTIEEQNLTIEKQQQTYQ